MVTLIVKKEIEQKEISSKFKIECKNWLEVLFFKIKYGIKGYKVEVLKNDGIN